MSHWRTQGMFYWPSDHYSVPADNLCWHAAPSPYADHFCIREEGHPGKHKFECTPILRSFSHKGRKEDDQ